MHTTSHMISDISLNKEIQIESAGNPNAKAPTSSAAGLGQFINATWDGMIVKHRPDLLKGRTKEQVRALRVGTETASLQVEILARFTEDNAKGLGPGYSDGDLYLAHFLGLGAARQVLRTDPSTSSRAVCGEAAYKANRSIFDKNPTCGQLRRWALDSMNNRWDRAKPTRPNWVAKWYDGKPKIAPVEPPTKPIEPPPRPPDLPGKTGGATATGAGWGFLEWLQMNRWGIALFLLSVACIATTIYFVRKDRRERIENTNLVYAEVEEEP